MSDPTYPASDEQDAAGARIAHFFRHEYGSLVALLCRQVGVHRIEAVEDAVQSALMRAVQSWTVNGEPENPSGWLYRVARNALVGELRKKGRRQRLLKQGAEDREQVVMADVGFAGEIGDEMLRLLFVCCDPAIPLESQLVIALKTLCGFSVREISQRLFISEANVYKRLARARKRLRELGPPLKGLSDSIHEIRLPAVHTVLYVLFTEGYLSYNDDLAIRVGLCREAIRLTTLLADHAVGKTPTTYALLALMHLHTARMTARVDTSGALLLLSEQDRSGWDRGEIQTGLGWLAKSAEGNVFSRFHAEAGIAVEHCLAPSYDETRWDRVVHCYVLLEQEAPSSLHSMNRAVAVAEWKGPAAGLLVLENTKVLPGLAASYVWAAVAADLHRRCGDQVVADEYRLQALALAPTEAIRALLRRRLGSSSAAFGT